MQFKPSLHKVHVFEKSQKERVIINNLAIDWKMGHWEIVQKVLDVNPSWRKEFEMKLSKPIKELKKDSLLLLVLSTSGICDANCEICYTDRKASKDELSFEELKNVIEQGKSLGIKTIYIPGEGEPFQAPYFLELMQYIHEMNLNLVVFTNGILLSDEKKFREKWGISLSEFISNYIKDRNVYFYIKMWHILPEKIEKLLGTNINLRKFQVGEKGIFIPLILYNLLQDPELKQKAGIETAVFSENVDIIEEFLVPFVKETGIKWYLEPILHAGRYFGRHDLDLTPEQEKKFASMFTKQQCKRSPYTLTVSSKGHITFCPVFPYVLRSYFKRDLKESIYMRNIRDVSIFETLHLDEDLIKLRYGSLLSKFCICEWLSNQLELTKTPIFLKRQIIDLTGEVSYGAR